MSSTSREHATFGARYHLHPNYLHISLKILWSIFKILYFHIVFVQEVVIVQSVQCENDVRKNSKWAPYRVDHDTFDIIFSVSTLIFWGGLWSIYGGANYTPLPGLRPYCRIYLRSRSSKWTEMMTNVTVLYRPLAHGGCLKIFNLMWILQIGR